MAEPTPGAEYRARGAELRLVALPLVAPFRASWGVETERLALLIRVETSDGPGWGECVAMREPLYTSEYVAGALDVLRRVLVPRWLAGVSFDPVQGHSMAKCGLELAMLDATARAAGESLQQRLGGTGDRVEVGVVCDPRRIPEGYKRVKIKVSPGRDIEEIAIARAAGVGARASAGRSLWVDANGSYPDAASVLPLDRLGLGLIEQPLAPDRLVAHVELVARLTTPVSLDESLTSVAIIADAVALGAADVVSIKPGRMGGYLAAVEAVHRCAAAGVPAWVGGMLETGIGRAANLALASVVGFTLPGDISATDRYFHEDVTAPFVLGPEATIEVPTGHGIGVEMIASVLARRTVHREVIRR